MESSLGRTPHAELEVTLSRALSGGYRAELRFSRPDSETEIPPVRGTLSLDPELLLEHQHDPRTYAATLTEALFADQALRTFYAQVQAMVGTSDLVLRLRLRVDSTAQELHALRWELLRDPETDVSLATSQRILFSRFMASADWRRVKIGPKADLRALVAVAAPTDLARRGLAEVDLDGEIGRARAGLEGIDLTVVGKDEPLTLERLVEALSPHPDLLYLVCHGALSRRSREPALYLQDDDGKVAICRGNELAERLAELACPPRLAVLASCESAGTEGAADALAAQAALAPRLAEAGLAAVLAMQGKVSMATVETMMPVFFRELLADGQIDRALAVARGAVRERGDSWMPALYMRLKRGRIWYEPGFSGDEGDFSKWRSIVSSASQGNFVPILGPDVAEQVYGTTRDLAEGLAERHSLPLSGRQRGDLAKVTQFLSVDESRIFARDEVLKLCTKEVLARHPDLEPAAAGPLPALPKLLDQVVERQGAKDPFKVLAALPARIYVNAGRDPLLIKSLKAAGREPQPLLCDWRATADSHPAPPVYDDEPSAGRPLVHHVFGVLAKEDSLVLTEDDFFDYLIAATEYKLIPSAVRGALTRGSLLFLGFPLDDWMFRVLFRLIMALDGKQRLNNYAHVGVQVDPEEYSEADVEKARRHLEQYFTVSRDTPPISVYWGSPRDFLEELRRQMSRGTTQLRVISQEDVDDWLS